MAKKKAASQETAGQRKLRLIVSDDKKPSVQLKPGMKFEVVSVSLVDPAIKPVKATAARLCGGTSTCIALVETDE